MQALPCPVGTLLSSGAMELRLFPLQTVLFPGMRLPLHIFEDRYKQMIRECIEQDAPFGVVLIREGAEAGGGAVPHHVGTTARIAQVEYLDDGRMNIFTIGMQRFRLRRVNARQPYLTGDVDLIEQEGEYGAEADVQERVQAVFNDYLRTYFCLNDQWTAGLSLPRDTGEAADFIAARTDAPPPLKQEWLEQLAPGERLRRELAYMEDELPEMRLRLRIRLRQKTAGFGVLN
jgi:Lon protease-like protein